MTAANKLDGFNRQAFSDRKGSNTYRIFCLGGSTTFGRPYDDATSFCGWLRELLPVADPSRSWEVVNAGGISYASYRVAIVMEELLRYQPDLFIIYSGHNEFLERRTYQKILETPSLITGAVALLSRTRTYSALQMLLDATASEPAPTDDERYLLPAEVDTILDHTVGPSSYTRDDELRQQIIDHYRLNLDRMAALARAAGAQVLLVTTPSNLRHCSPFKSEHRAGLSATDLDLWQSLYQKAEVSAESSQLGDGLAALEQAEAIDDRYADLHFRKGRILLDLGRYEQARSALQRARDEDICPVRALTPMIDVVRQVAAERNVPLVDFAETIERRSAHGIPDEQFFLDHVHPTIAGNRLLALILIDTLQARGIVQPVPSWNEEAVAAVARAVESRIDAKAHATALLNLSKVMGWAGKFEEASKLVTLASETLGGDPDVLFGLALKAGRTQNKAEEERLYREALRIMPQHPKAQLKLGLLLESKGDVAGAIAHYRLALESKPDFVEAHHNLGALLLKQRKTTEAEAHFQQALRIMPDHAKTHFKLGILRQTQGNVTAAIRQYRTAQRIHPDFFEAHHNLALLLAGQGKFDEAVRHMAEVVRLKPESADVRKKLRRIKAMRDKQ